MSAAPPTPPATRDLAYHEAVPYLLVLESVEREGRWLRRAVHPEIPGCVAEAPSVLEAMERLEHERRRLLRHLWNQGAPIPVSRPPLRRSDRSTAGGHPTQTIGQSPPTKP